MSGRDHDLHPHPAAKRAHIRQKLRFGAKPAPAHDFRNMLVDLVDAVRRFVGEFAILVKDLPALDQRAATAQ